MARKKQDTLVLYPDVYMSTDKFTDAQFGALMRAAFSYRFEDIPYTGDDLMVELMFNVIQTQLDRYKEVCRQNKTNIEKRYAEDSEEDEQPEDTESYETLRKPTHNHNHTHTHTHTHNHNHNRDHNHIHNHSHIPENGNETPDENIQPSIADVDVYCQEHGLRVEPIEFWSYYYRRQWKDENGDPIKDWRALMQTWHKTQRDPLVKPYVFDG